MIPRCISLFFVCTYCRWIGGTGYFREPTGGGAQETEEKSIVVRSVSADRSSGSSEASDSDRRIWELGISIEGSYKEFEPTNFEELNNILKTSGLGLHEHDDQLTFFMFVPRDMHDPESQPVKEVIEARLPAREEELAYTHVLLTTPEDNSARGIVYSEISEAGGRFLVDLERPGSVKMEAVSFHPLAVRPAASVAVVSPNSVPRLLDCLSLRQSSCVSRLLRMHPENILM